MNRMRSTLRRSADLSRPVGISRICNPQRSRRFEAAGLPDTLPNAIRRYSTARSSRNQCTPQRRDEPREGTLSANLCVRRVSAVSFLFRKPAQAATILADTGRVQLCARSGSHALSLARRTEEGGRRRVRAGAGTNAGPIPPAPCRTTPGRSGTARPRARPRTTSSRLSWKWCSTNRIQSGQIEKT